MAKIEVTGDLKALASLGRQITFAAARALTRSAKDGQAASLKAIRSTFTTRNDWYLPGNRLGVRVTPATKNNLESRVRSAADFLVPHETGEDKVPRGGQHLAVPTPTLRPSKRSPIPRGLRPKNLKGAFVLKTRKGLVIAQRRGRRLAVLYGLEPRARIRKQSTIVEPTVKAVGNNFGNNFGAALREALRTAR